MFFQFLQFNVYRDTYGIVNSVSWYVSYHEDTLPFHATNLAGNLLSITILKPVIEIDKSNFACHTPVYNKSPHSVSLVTK